MQAFSYRISVANLITILLKEIERLCANFYKILRDQNRYL